MKGPDKTHLPLRRKTVTHTTGYLRMKDDSARKFLASILTLVITAITTWQSQHEAHIAARLKLITRLQKETILAALINDHERRHGQKITTYHDPRYYMVFVIEESHTSEPRSEVGQRESVKIQWQETSRHCSDALNGRAVDFRERHGG